VVTRVKNKGRAKRTTPSTARRNANVPSNERGGRRVRVTFHISVELMDETRDVVVALSGPPDRLTLSDFAESALRREVERLKRIHQSGKSFVKRDREVRRGRPIK
jgi:hypothetical protein